MRIRDLARASGLPKTTIHYYTREGLLHPPAKAAANSARYDDTHVERLALIQRLRATEGPGLSVFAVRRVITLMDDGVPFELAVALQDAVQQAGGARAGGSLSLAGLCRRSGLARRAADAAVAKGVLCRAPHEAAFDAADLEGAGHVRALLDAGIRIDELEHIASLVRAISAYEIALAGRLAAGRSASGRAALFQALQAAGNGFHQYQFLRARQHEIARGATVAQPRGDSA